MHTLPKFAILIVVTLAASSAYCAEHSDLFGRLDANADGQLTKAELPAEQAALFRRLIRNADSDADGRLSLSEFEAGLTSNRPAKPLTEKAESELPGADALLLVLAWMDRNADLAIDINEVPQDLRPLYNQFVGPLNLPEDSHLPVPQLRQQAGRYGALAQVYLRRQGFDLEVELALLNNKQLAYIERLRSSLRPGSMLANPKNAAVAFSQLDTNGDGKVTLAEVPEPFADRFAVLMERADRNQDKQLSEEEIKYIGNRIALIESNRPPLAKSNQRVKQLLRRADRDADGRLSRDEIPPRLSNRFASIDKNGDGYLNNQELVRAAEILAALRNSAEQQNASSSDSAKRHKKQGQK